MDQEQIELVGYVAAFLTTASFIPQAWKSWSTRDLAGISLPMYAMFTMGVAMWLVYGVWIKSLPVVIANVITLILSMLILGLKIQQVLSANNTDKH